jgi:hypothetical protein
MLFEESLPKTLADTAKMKMDNIKNKIKNLFIKTPDRIKAELQFHFLP